MANTEVVDIIIGLTSDILVYMLPIIGTLAGVNFVITWLMSITMGLGKRTFKG